VAEWAAAGSRLCSRSRGAARAKAQRERREARAALNEERGEEDELVPPTLIMLVLLACSTSSSVRKELADGAERSSEGGPTGARRRPVRVDLRRPS